MRLSRALQKAPREIAIGGGWINSRATIFQAQPELFQRSRQLPRGMLVIAQLRGPRDEAFDSATLQVRFKSSIRIEEVAHDQVEPAEVSDQLRRKHRILREKPRERSILNRANRVGVEPLFRQGDDVRITENLDVRPGKAVPQKF